MHVKICFRDLGIVLAHLGGTTEPTTTKTDIDIHVEICSRACQGLPEPARLCQGLPGSARAFQGRLQASIPGLVPFTLVDGAAEPV